MNRKSGQFAVALIAAALMPGIALADAGLFFGGAMGSASVDDRVDDFAIDDDVLAWRAFGGLSFGRLLAVEAGYQDFGEIDRTFDLGGTTAVSNLSADGWTLGGRVDLPLSRSVSLFGRGGVFAWQADIEVDGVRRAFDDDSNPYYGAGAAVMLSPRLSLLGDWTRYELDEADADVFALGIEYRFGR